MKFSEKLKKVLSEQGSDEPIELMSLVESKDEVPYMDAFQYADIDDAVGMISVNNFEKSVNSIIKDLKKAGIKNEDDIKSYLITLIKKIMY